MMEDFVERVLIIALAPKPAPAPRQNLGTDVPRCLQIPERDPGVEIGRGVLRSEEEPPAGHSKPSTLSFNVQSHAYKLLGTDLFRIRGLNAETVLRIVSEVGVDLSAFPTEKHFASWLCLSPNRRESGGRLLSSRTRPSGNRAAAAFRQAAVSVERSDTELGAYYRRKRAQAGGAYAVTATAHKLSRLYYSLVKHGREYEEHSGREYEARERERVVAKLQKRAQAFGFALVAQAA